MDTLHKVFDDVNIKKICFLLPVTAAEGEFKWNLIKYYY